VIKAEYSASLLRSSVSAFWNHSNRIICCLSMFIF